LRYLFKGVIEDCALLYSTFSCNLVSFSSFLPLFSQGQARPRKSGDRNPNHFGDSCTWIPVFTPARWSASARKHGNDRIEYG